MRLLHEYENLIVIGYENVISRNIMGGIFRLTQQTNERRIYMLLAILQILLKICAIFALAFMVVCTVFVVVCIVRGDIKINIVRSNEEKENE